jgi:preprotein translocase SecE subunit
MRAFTSMSKTTPANPGPSNPGGSSSGKIPIPGSKRGVKGFFVDVGREMKKVNWPNKRETNRLTGVVLAVCFLVVVLLTGMSIVSDMIVRLVTEGRV